jgi:prevent-host-death family protein
MAIDIFEALLMLNHINAMTLRQNLGSVLNEVCYKHDHMMILRAGKPIAVIIDVDTFNAKIRGSEDQDSQSLKAFFQSNPCDLSSFRFNRDEANDR